jgi:predicted nucleotidyltransferase
MIAMLQHVAQDRLDALCRKWRVRELALFGSVARGEATPDSDVDVLVTFEAEADWSLLDLIRLQDELASLFGREVDLVEEAALRNPFRRRAILRDKRVLHAAWR